MNNKKTIITSKEEVLRILENIFLSRTHIALEQDFESVAKISWSIIENINQHSYDLAIRPTDKLNQFDFNKKSKISILSDSKAIHFNVKPKGLYHKNLIIVEIPEELEIFSTRIADRENLMHLNAEVKYKNLSIKSYPKRKKIRNASLDELSENGISFKLPYDVNLGFRYNDKIIINSINKYSLSFILEGKIVYLQDFLGEDKNDACTKVGVKFNKKIEMEKILRYLDIANYLNKMAS